MPTRAPTSTSAERQRRCRDRRREGVRVAPVDYGPEVIGALIEEGWLGADEGRNGPAIAATLSDLVYCWAYGNLQPVKNKGNRLSRVTR